ncbi:MAG: hypothetical protein ACAF41_26445 [Leptolyngbya sp. BL-A-14]
MRNIVYLLIFSLPLLTSCISEKSAQIRNESSQVCATDVSQNSPTGTRKIAPENLRVSPVSSTPVISNAQKFILPIPALGNAGEPLVYPQSYEKAGQPILDYTGKPVGDRGLVFFNGKDRSWQAVLGDGNGVIIINEVTQDQASKLDQKIRSLKPNPNDLTLSELKQVLTFAQQLGLVDMYNSTRAFVKEKMTPVNTGDQSTLASNEVEAYGFKKRDDRDVNQAIYIPGAFVFEGPAASPQEFKNGGVIVVQDGKMRGVQPDIFVRTYKLSNGRTINSVTGDLKHQCETR